MQFHYVQYSMWINAEYIEKYSVCHTEELLNIIIHRFYSFQIL